MTVDCEQDVFLILKHFGFLGTRNILLLNEFKSTYFLVYLAFSKVYVRKTATTQMSQQLEIIQFHTFKARFLIDKDRLNGNFSNLFID